MLLILIAALMSFYVGRLHIIGLFIIISHALLWALYIFIGVDEKAIYAGVIISALISIAVGFLIYGWMFWYRGKHDPSDVKRIKWRMAKILGTFILLAGAFNILSIYQGIESGKRLVAEARVKSIETQNFKVQEPEIENEVKLNPNQFFPAELASPSGVPTAIANNIAEQQAKDAWGAKRDVSILEEVYSCINMQSACGSIKYVLTITSEGMVVAGGVIILVFAFLRLLKAIAKMQAWKREEYARILMEIEGAAVKSTGEENIHVTNEEKVTEGNQSNGFDLFFSDTKRLMSFGLTWSERTTLEKSYTVIFAIMLVGLLPMPYEFYDNLRVIVCLCLYFYFQAILPERGHRRGWFITIIGLLILYNPVAPIRTGEQAVWTLINAAVIYALYRARLIFDHKNDESAPDKM